MMEFSLFGRRLFAVSDRTYDMWSVSTIGTRIAIVVIGISLCIGIPYGLAEIYGGNPTATNVPVLTIPAVAATETADLRASDVEPETIEVYTRNPRFFSSTFELRNCRGGKVSRKFQKQQGDTGFFITKLPSPDFLTVGPYLITVREADGKVISGFRVDQTSSGNSVILHLLVTPGSLEPALRNYNSGTWYRPLGRETYPFEPLG